MTTPGRARVLKAADVGTATPVRGPVPSSDGDTAPHGTWRRAAVHEANEEAKRIVENARLAATALLEATERDVLHVAEAARAQATAEVRAEWTAAFEALHSATLLEGREHEEHVVTLAKLLAERLVSAELAVRPDAIGALARQVLREARGATTFVLSAHPSQIERLRALLDGAHPGLTLREHSALDVADIRLETDVGDVDGRLKTELDRLGRVLIGGSR